MAGKKGKISGEGGESKDDGKGEKGERKEVFISPLPPFLCHPLLQCAPTN